MAHSYVINTNMVQERIAFMKNPRTAEASSFARQANLEPRRLSRLPNDLSPEYQIRSVLLQYLTNHNDAKLGKEQAPEPFYCIVADKPDELLNAAKKVLNGSESTKSRENIQAFFRALTIVKLNSTTHSDKTDETTGIRVAELIKGELPQPVHPTPNS